MRKPSRLIPVAAVVVLAAATAGAVAARAARPESAEQMPLVGGGRGLAA